MITKFKIFEYIQITENPSFKKWFRNSKVVDKNGHPLVLYHGTNADFSEFVYSKFGNNTGAPLSALGFYFTAEHELASKFTKGKNWMKNSGKYKNTANLIAAYLSLQNPKYMTADEWLQMSGRSILRIKELREDLINQGYDGIIIAPQEYDFTGELKTPQYVAFFSNLVKSAIGNNGDFDLNNFNINEKFSDRKPGKEGLLNSKSISKEIKDPQDLKIAADVVEALHKSGAYDKQRQTYKDFILAQGDHLDVERIEVGAPDGSKIEGNLGGWAAMAAIYGRPGGQGGKGGRSGKQGGQQGGGVGAAVGGNPKTDEESAQDFFNNYGYWPKWDPQKRQPDTK